MAGTYLLAMIYYFSINLKQLLSGNSLLTLAAGREEKEHSQRHFYSLPLPFPVALRGISVSIIGDT